MRRLSSIRNERKNDAVNEKFGIPGIVSLPAFPKVPVAGITNAAVLKKPEPEVTGRPVASARALPVYPVPEGSPFTIAVNGVPDVAVRTPATVHPRRRSATNPDRVLLIGDW